MLSIGGSFCGDKVFRVHFDDKGDLKFDKGLDLLKFKEGPIAIQCIAYW